MAADEIILHRAAGITHVGCVRARNEDSFLLKQEIEKDCLLAVVADGMGGHLGGAIASSMAISFFDAGWDLLCSGSKLATSLLDGAWLTRIAQLAQESIRLRAHQDPELNNMGTTLVAVAMCGLRASIAYIGDSRAYYFSDGVLKQVSRDHSLVQRMVDEGSLTEEEAERSPLRNYLTRSLGAGEQGGKPDVCSLDLKPGDRLLLCSDGLTNMLSNADIAEIISANLNDETACRSLLALALDRKANDNVSIILCTAAAGE